MELLLKLQRRRHLNGEVDITSPLTDIANVETVDSLSVNGSGKVKQLCQEIEVGFENQSPRTSIEGVRRISATRRLSRRQSRCSNGSISVDSESTTCTLRREDDVVEVNSDLDSKPLLGPVEELLVDEAQPEEELDPFKAAEEASATKLDPVLSTCLSNINSIVWEMSNALSTSLAESLSPIEKVDVREPFEMPLPGIETPLDPFQYPPVVNCFETVSGLDALSSGKNEIHPGFFEPGNCQQRALTATPVTQFNCFLNSKLSKTPGAAPQFTADSLSNLCGEMRAASSYLPEANMPSTDVNGSHWHPQAANNGIADWSQIHPTFPAYQREQTASSSSVAPPSISIAPGFLAAGHSTPPAPLSLAATAERCIGNGSRRRYVARSLSPLDEQRVMFWAEEPESFSLPSKPPSRKPSASPPPQPTQSQGRLRLGPASSSTEGSTQSPRGVRTLIEVFSKNQPKGSETTSKPGSRPAQRVGSPPSIRTSGNAQSPSASTRGRSPSSPSHQADRRILSPGSPSTRLPSPPASTLRRNVSPGGSPSGRSKPNTAVTALLPWPRQSDLTSQTRSAKEAALQVVQKKFRGLDAVSDTFLRSPPRSPQQSSRTVQRSISNAGVDVVVETSLRSPPRSPQQSPRIVQGPAWRVSGALNAVVIRRDGIVPRQNHR